MQNLEKDGPQYPITINIPHSTTDIHLYRINKNDKKFIELTITITEEISIQYYTFLDTKIIVFVRRRSATFYGNSFIL